MIGLCFFVFLRLVVRTFFLLPILRVNPCVVPVTHADRMTSPADVRHKRFACRQRQQRAKVPDVFGCFWTIFAPSMGIIRTYLHTNFQLAGVGGRLGTP